MTRPMETSWTWCIGNVTLHVGVGDLFRVQADAVVNSEQTDFLLSSNPDTISGQLHHRFGAALQAELTALVGLDVDGLKYPTLPVGTVLRTSGGGDYRAIFHAGFHHPNVWLHGDADTNGADHLRVIRACICEILQRAADEGLASVAFPLIGTGVFELDPAMLAHEFFDAVAQFAISPRQPELVVWLVTRSEEALQKLIVAGTQAWTQKLRPSEAAIVHDLGVGYLDTFFASQVGGETHPKWAVWVWCRYAELVTGYLSFTLCKAEQPLEPREITAEGHPLGFGRLLEIANRRAKEVEVASLSRWGVLARSLVLEAPARVNRLVADRNSLAHGRAVRALDAVRDDVRAFVGRAGWLELAQDAGPPEVALEPFIESDGAGGPAGVGVLDSVQAKGRIKYLVPASGRTFTRP